MYYIYTGNYFLSCVFHLLSNQQLQYKYPDVLAKPYRILDISLLPSSFLICAERFGMSQGFLWVWISESVGETPNVLFPTSTLGRESSHLS